MFRKFSSFLLFDVVCNYVMKNLVWRSLQLRHEKSQPMRSTTCKGNNGQYLEEYHSQTAAAIASEEIQKTYGNTLTPFQCRSCGYWHLGAVNTRLQCMLCTDSGLFLKDLYASREEALSTAAYIRRERKVHLYPYKCPHTNGWHLTKTEPGRGSKGRR